jgi:hypothetical protein
MPFVSIPVASPLRKAVVSTVKQKTYGPSFWVANQVICASILDCARSFLVGTPVGSQSPHTACSVGEYCLILIEEAGTIQRSEMALRASGPCPILEAWSLYADLYGSDLLLGHLPDPDQHGTAHEVVKRIPGAPCGFVNLMLPFLFPPAIQRANKVRSEPQTTGVSSSCDTL